MVVKSNSLFDVGVGSPIILLHGLFGNLSNWENVAREFSTTNRVLIPHLPLYKHPITQQTLNDLVEFLESFVEEHDLRDIILMGNSLGGHVALLYSLKHPAQVKRLILAGSSGLYENSFSGSFPRVKDYSYIQEKVQQTFFKAEVATKQLIDEVYETVQSRTKTLSIIGLARAAQKQNLSNALPSIAIPTLLIWGLQDTITPPAVAIEFYQKLPNAEIVFLEQCGHVPMMEQPKLFNRYVREFLGK